MRSMSTRIREKGVCQKQGHPFGNQCHEKDPPWVIGNCIFCGIL
jgi:hypothetical protein